MHKGYKKTIAILITFALISALLCFPVSAAVNGHVFITMPISKPNATEGFYYVEMITKESDGTLYAWVFMINDNNNNGCNFIINGKAVTITTYGPSSVVIIKDTGHVYNKGSNTNGGSYNASFSGTIIGVTAYGNVITNSNLNSGVDIVYGDDNISVQLLLSILNTLNAQSNGDIISNQEQIGQDIQDNADKNASEIQKNDDQNTSSIVSNQNQNAQDIQDNQDKNTQSIIDNQNELAEQEKQEITDSGNQATDAMDSIPNESEGFINALGTFVSTMSTTDTACSITFPAIKTPSFAGIPAATLSEEKEVDFSTAISLIPSDIMRLIQALTTIALIVFCFKELYDTISEALTRKKANSDG